MKKIDFLGWCEPHCEWFLIPTIEICPYKKANYFGVFLHWFCFAVGFAIRGEEEFFNDNDEIDMDLPFS